MSSAVNVKISEALEPGFHGCLSDFAIRYFNLDRSVDQVETTGTNLLVYHGAPTPDVGSNRITYDGTCGTLKTSDGRPLQAFDLPIS